jgi:tol-pal system protein YbgF
MRRPVLVGAFLLGLAVCPFVAPVHAQDGDVGVRLDRMERDLDTLNRSVFRGEKPPAGSVPGASSSALQSQMDDRLSQLENDLRSLTGKVEEQGNTMNQLKAQLDRVVADMGLRLTALEQKGGLAPTPAASESVLVTPPDVPPTGTISVTQPVTTTAPNDPAPATSPTVKPLGNLANVPTSTGDTTQDYENAMALLKQRDYAAAEKSLTAFLKNHPQDNLATNAKYWLGETYFAQNHFDMAARIFAEGYQQDPKGPKAPDNLLKLGLSLSAQKNTADACVAFKQIGKDFPTTANAVNARATQEIKRLKCGG